MRRAPGVALDCALQHDGMCADLGPRVRGDSTRKGMLAHPNGRHAETHADKARDPEAGGMQSSVTVDEQDIGSMREAIHGALDPRDFSISQVGRDVGEVDPISNACDFEWFEILGIDAHGDRVRPAPFVREIDAGDRAKRVPRVRLDHRAFESDLLLPQGGEETNPRKAPHEPCLRDAISLRAQALVCELLESARTDGTSIRSDDPMGPGGARMFSNPRCDGPGRAHVTERPRDRPARRDAASRNLLETGEQGSGEIRFHGGGRPLPRKTFLQTTPSAATMSLLLRGGLIVTQDPERRIVAGDLLVEEGRIAAIGEVDRSADSEIDCTGSAVIPGLINLHNHVPNTLVRGIADDVPLEELLSKASAVDANLTRRDVQIGALLGCVEMIRSGTTSFHDLFFWEDEVARAVRESGMRGFLSWVTLDEAFTTQHGSPLKNADGFVGKHKGDPLVTPSVGVQGVYAASEETYTKAREIAARHGVRMHTHLSETRTEVESHRRRTGLRPVEWLEKIGFLDPRLTAAHGVWLTMNEVRTLARHGVSVAHCPVSNMKLASGGVAPVPEMIREEVTVGLGTDSPISNNGMDLFADMKIEALLHKASRWDAETMPAQTVLDLATISAAKALRVDEELGSIEVGKRADLAVVSLKGAHTTPFYPDSVLSRLVYSCRGSDVQATVVDGQILMADGVVRTVDEAEVVARAQETARELFEA